MSADAQIGGAGGIPTVRVRGEAVVRAEPDEAILWVTLSALEETPGLALADVSRRSEALLALLDDLDLASSDRSTTGVSVYEEFDHAQGWRRSLGHRAVARVSLRLADPDLIGRIVTRATAELDARIDGPRWQIAPENPVRLQAATKAASDARRKAEAYAEGVGARVGRLMSLAEPSDQPFARRAGGMRPLAAAGGEPPMPIEPGEHEVAAAIDATFAVELD